MSASRASAASVSPLLPAVTSVAVMISASGSSATWALVAVETAGAGLVAVPGLAIHRRDDPIRGDFAGNPEHVAAVNQVLPQHRGQHTDRRTRTDNTWRE
jgi:hypothetical protein